MACVPCGNLQRGVVAKVERGYGYIQKENDWAKLPGNCFVAAGSQVNYYRCKGRLYVICSEVFKSGHARFDQPSEGFAGGKRLRLYSPNFRPKSDGILPYGAFIGGLRGVGVRYNFAEDPVELVKLDGFTFYQCYFFRAEHAVVAGYEQR